MPLTKKGDDNKKMCVSDFLCVVMICTFCRDKQWQCIFEARLDALWQIWRWFAHAYMRFDTCCPFEST